MNAPLGKYRNAARTGAVGWPGMRISEPWVRSGTIASNSGSPKATPVPRRNVRREIGLNFTPMAAFVLGFVIPMAKRITDHDGLQQPGSSEFTAFKRPHAIVDHAQVHAVDFP